MDLTLVLQLALQGFLMGGVYSLIALGLSLIFGVMKVINFAHGEMMVFAMFLSITLLLGWGIDPYLSLLLVAGLMFGVGYLVQRVFVNRILDLPEAMQVLVLVGLGIIFENGTLMIWGGSDISPKTSLALSSLRWGPVTVDVPRLIAFALAIIITLAVLIFLKKTTIGKAIRAAADNRFGALIIGTHINRLYGICFGIGAACVGAAGALLVPLMPAKATMGAPLHHDLFRHRHSGRNGQPGRRPGRRPDHWRGRVPGHGLPAQLHEAGGQLHHHGGHPAVQAPGAVRSKILAQKIFNFLG
jgi:branched-chain amino acid transport system permease protein